jgi:hypothetical protein
LRRARAKAGRPRRDRAADFGRRRRDFLCEGRPLCRTLDTRRTPTLSAG